MPTPTCRECYFYQQMFNGSQYKLHESRPALSGKDHFTKSEKRDAIDKLLAGGYVSGYVGVNSNGSYNYQTIYLTDTDELMFKLVCADKV